MATQIAENMSTDDKSNVDNMDIEKMISHVTKNMMKVLGNNSTRLIEHESETESETECEQQTKDITFNLSVKLEDFFNGNTKKLNVKVKRIINDQVVTEKLKLEINIEKGMCDGHEIRFKGQADQLPGITPGDIIITLTRQS